MAKVKKNMDYYGAFLLRYKDFEHLINQENEESIIFAIYSGGVCIECMLCSFVQKIYIDKNAVEITFRDHDILDLYDKAKNQISYEKKHKLNELILTVNEYWSNELRYFSVKELKKQEINKILKDKKVSLKTYYKEMINTVKELFEIGDLYGK